MTVRILHGDCLALLPTLDADSVHACVTDPPYGLEFMGKQWDAPWKDGWQSGAGFSKPGIGERKTEWPSFTSGNDQFGGANPTCATCGGRARGKKKCACAEPNWKVKGAAPDPMYGRARQMQTYQTWCEAWAREVFRVLKPGAHLLAFGGTRTYHRMVCAIEDAGFEIRDTTGWLYGAGFPKSLNVNKALAGVCCECESPSQSKRDLRFVSGADVPAPINAADEPREVLFEGVSEQSSLSNWTQSSKGRSGRQKPSMEGWRDIPTPPRELCPGSLREVPARVPGDVQEGRLCYGAPSSNGAVGGAPPHANGVRPSCGPQPPEQRQAESGIVAGQSQPQDGGAWPVCRGCGKPRIPTGLGTALKPAMELIVVARKPLDGTVAANVLKHGCGALNIDASRVEGPMNGVWGTSNATVERGRMFNGSPDMGEYRSKKHPLGRWPANIAHDGSEEVLAAFADYGDRSSTRANGNPNDPIHGSNGSGSSYEWGAVGRKSVDHRDTGTAARFFYSAKATAQDRAGSKHPTVKPLALMEWLVKLVTPPGGTVLDPFAGTGSTLLAADRLQFNAIGIEQSAEYVADAKRKIGQDAGLFGLFDDASPDSVDDQETAA